MAEPFTVQIHGLRETTRALRQVDRALPKMLRLKQNEAAQGIVLDARRRYARRYRSRRSRTVNSIRARSTQAKGRVLGGGKRFPWFKGQEFGSSAPKMRRFWHWSGAGPGGAGSRGWFLYPAARDGIADFRDELEQGIEQVARAAALRTRGF